MELSFMKNVLGMIISDTQLFAVTVAVNSVALIWLYSFVLLRVMLAGFLSLLLSLGLQQRTSSFQKKWEQDLPLNTFIYAASATATTNYYFANVTESLIILNVLGSFFDGLLEVFFSHVFQTQSIQQAGRTNLQEFRSTFLGVFTSFSSVILSSAVYKVQEGHSMFGNTKAIWYFLATFCLSIVAVDGGLTTGKLFEMHFVKNWRNEWKAKHVNEFLLHLPSICFFCSVFTLAVSGSYQLLVGYVFAGFGCLFGALIEVYVRSVFRALKDTELELLIPFVSNVTASVFALSVLFQCRLLPTICQQQEMLVSEFTESFLASASAFTDSAKYFHSYSMSLAKNLPIQFHSLAITHVPIGKGWFEARSEVEKTIIQKSSGPDRSTVRKRVLGELILLGSCLIVVSVL